MAIRVAVTEVSHWHALENTSYLSHLQAFPDTEIVAIQDPDVALAAEKGAEVGAPPVYADYKDMLAATKPDFVIVLGRHSVMAEIAHHLLDEGYPFLIEKPAGLNADEVHGLAEKVEATGGFAAVPLFHRYAPFVDHARALIADGRLGPLSHVTFRTNRLTTHRYADWGSPWMLDPAVSGGGVLLNLGIHGFGIFLSVTGEEAEVVAAQISSRTLDGAVEDYRSCCVRKAASSAVSNSAILSLTAGPSASGPTAVSRFRAGTAC